MEEAPAMRKGMRQHRMRGARDEEKAESKKAKVQWMGWNDEVLLLLHRTKCPFSVNE
jgi:hypothetical protein